MSDATVIVDIGKTNAKLSLWGEQGEQLARDSRPNMPCVADPHRALDRQGIENWLLAILTRYAKQANVRQIIPVGHGAAAALIRNGAVFAEPMDYEADISDALRMNYLLQRDSFTSTGSAALPSGMNLGLQLHSIEVRLGGPLPEDVAILPWPQYWAWRLCGIAASEVTSLGCHTDLWRPLEARFSNLATKRGWASRFAPLRRADAELGQITPNIAAQTGLPSDCKVFCGLHDSNAALLAARGHRELRGSDATILSTGTWFVAMRSLASDLSFDPRTLVEGRDCLINVNIDGRPVPSARFMGGREAEMIGAFNAYDVTRDYNPEAALDRAREIVAAGASALPSFVAGVGPYPETAGTWHNKPADPVGVQTVAELYLALMADTSLDLIGSRNSLLIEGRFADSALFVRALAALRPQQKIYKSHAEHDVAYGALRLVDPTLAPSATLERVAALPIDLQEYAAVWRARARCRTPT